MKRVVFIIVILLPVVTLGQFVDDFTDGNFAENPSWIGDTAAFEVNSSHQLQLHSEGADTSTLVTQTTMMVSSEWDFWVKVSFNTSVNNYTRVYLVSNTPDLTGSVNGYYLQIGGSNDSVEFRKQSGLIHQKLFRGTRTYTGNSTNVIRFKVIHDLSGIWHLLSDNSGDKNFLEEGSCSDNTYLQTEWFGVFCKYTSSNATKIYFDDFYCGPIIVDTIPPSIQNLSVNPPNKLEIRFSEAIDKSNAEDPEIYETRSSGKAQIAVLDAVDQQLVHLEFATAFQDSSYDTLIVTDIKDLHGNSAKGIKYPFCYYLEKSFDIVIDEIMADPDPQEGLPDAEYVEIFNRTDYPIRIKDWIFEFGSYRKTLPDITIEKKGFMTLTKGTWLSFYGPSVDLFTSSTSLANEGTTLTLKNKEGKVIHSVTYSIDWFNNNQKKNGGWSLEMIDPGNPCGCGENWKASENPIGGTPSTINSVFASNPDTLPPRVDRTFFENDTTLHLFFSETMDSTSFGSPDKWIIDNDHPVSSLTPQPPDFRDLTLSLSSPLLQRKQSTLMIPAGLKDCAGNEPVQHKTVRIAMPDTINSSDLVINEILPNPYPYGERFIELFNRSLKVLDLDDLVFISDSNHIVSITESGFMIFPAEYILITKSVSDIRNHYYLPDTVLFIEMSAMPSMNDDSGRIILARKNDLKIIDRMTYSSSMQFPLLSSNDGVSLERIDPFGQSESKMNWHSAASVCGYATPGYKNSQSPEMDYTDNTIEITPAVFSPDNDGKDDLLLIRYHFEKGGYIANVAIYDAEGRIVKQLVRNELIGPNGYFSWDGLDQENRKAPIGIYLIYLELFNPDGEIRHFKKPAVLGTNF